MPAINFLGDDGFSQHFDNSNSFPTNSLSLSLSKAQDARAEGPRGEWGGVSKEVFSMVLDSGDKVSAYENKFLYIFRSLEIRHNSIPLNH